MSVRTLRLMATLLLLLGLLLLSAACVSPPER